MVAVTNSAGSATATNSYDEYGIPASTNIGRFQYTGQSWLPELGLYYYKARIYSPTLGRFLQTDPIGYKDGINWYDYVGGDPVNGVDPSGLSCTFSDGKKSVNCKFDDRQSFRDGGLSEKQIRQGEQNYANAVGKLLKNTNATQTVKIGDKSFKVTAGQVAAGLMKSYVTFQKMSGATASMAGGAMDTSSPAYARNPSNLPYVLRISDTHFYNNSGSSRSDAQQRGTIIHEGIHTAPGEGAMRGVSNFRTGHKAPYGQAAASFDELP